MKIMRLAAIALCSFFYVHAHVADLVVFSYDRPLQLFALLESMQKHMKGIGKAAVIYRASDANYKNAYDIVAKTYPQFTFIQQGDKPREDFKPLTLRAVFDSPSAYIIFAVDDNVVKGDVDLSACIDLLERTNAYGFYLRLGDHLNYCYPMNQFQKVPDLIPVQGDTFCWTFAGSDCDWGYPNTVDMTIYRKKEIERSLRDLGYHAPNSLEAIWASNAGPVMNRKGLCFKTSKIINLPLNRVQSEILNRCMEITAAELLTKFSQGLKLDIAPLFQIKNASAHMEYEPTYVVR